jgi:hypothetical protein
LGIKLKLIIRKLEIKALLNKGVVDKWTLYSSFGTKNDIYNNVVGIQTTFLGV